MSRFKAGDKVRVTNVSSNFSTNRHTTIGNEYRLTKDAGDFDGELSWSVDDPKCFYRYKESELELVHGPVCTETRKVIVPGVYDGVLVGEVIDGAVFVRTGLDDQGKRYRPNELKAVASILSQLADALESNK